jgi:FkbM family methyltransferase
MPPLRPRLRRLCNRLLPDIAIPLRISPGLWWIARNDEVSDSLFEGGFERADRAFVCRFLRPGMTVLDVGGHAGVYAMTAARAVGPTGRVITFEPSARERARLASHLRLNRIRNVTIEPLAVGSTAGTVDLHVADGADTGFNSLRPQPGHPAHATSVAMCTLDDYVARAAIAHVDFVKMDIEGGERDALVGAAALFRRDRPVLLCEIEPARIGPWGYAPEDIVDLVADWGYEWFTVTPTGLAPVNVRGSWSGNYVAQPRP